MIPFLTGSRVYGFPKEDSDIDLVCLLSLDQLSAIAPLADNTDDFGSPGGQFYDDGCSLRFGKLNLLVVTEKKHFDVWKQGTDELIAMKPVTRDKAIEHLATLRREKKIAGW